jgi:hypothetical protein
MTTIPEGWKLVRREVYDALAAGLGHVACLYFGTAPAAPEGAKVGEVYDDKLSEETWRMGGRPMTLRECMDAEDGGAPQTPAAGALREALHYFQFATPALSLTRRAEIHAAALKELNTPVAWALHYGDGVFKTLTMDRKYAEDEWGKDMATPLVAAPPHPAAQSHRPDPHDKSGTVLVAAPSPPTAQPPQPGVVLPNASTTQADYTGPTSNAEPPKDPTR